MEDMKKCNQLERQQDNARAQVRCFYTQLGNEMVKKSVAEHTTQQEQGSLKKHVSKRRCFVRRLSKRQNKTEHLEEMYIKNCRSLVTDLERRDEEGVL